MELKTYIVENKHFPMLNILSLGRHKCKPGYVFGYAYTNFYLIHYVIKGCGTFFKNGVPQKVKDGEIFIIKPDNEYTYIADEENPWEYIFFSFDGEMASRFEQLDDCMKFNSSVITDMLDAENLENTRSEFLTGKLFELMSEIFEDSGQKNDHIKKATDYIKTNYARKLPVADIAAALNLNPRYLSRIFKQSTGKTVQEYIINYKIKKAKILLKHGMSVGSTAKLIGYDDSFTFSKAFKKVQGVSPKEYLSKKKD